MELVALEKYHYPEVARIYQEGMDTGMATFETEVPTWEQWDKKFLPNCRMVVIADGQIIGWCALSAFSARKVYVGVAESTIYIASVHRGHGVGKFLLNALILQSEAEGYWTLQARIFANNQNSLHLHQSCGFRIVGLRERFGQRKGVWHDNILLERRSKVVHYT